jgi:hypothetical protein
VSGRAQRDYFTRHPSRITAAVQSGRLTFTEAAVLDALIRWIDRGDRSKYEQAVWTTTGGTAEAIGWDLTRDYLRRLLGRLKAKGWIHFELSERQRKPYLLRLTGAAIDGDENEATADTTADTTADSLALVSPQSTADTPSDERRASRVIEPETDAPDCGRTSEPLRSRSRTSTVEGSLRSPSTADGAQNRAAGWARETSEKETDLVGFSLAGALLDEASTRSDAAVTDIGTRRRRQGAVT